MSMNCVVISLLAFAMLLFVLVGVRCTLNEKEGFLEYIVYGRPGWGWRRWGGVPPWRRWGGVPPWRLYTF